MSIQVTGLCKAYGSKTLFSGLSFTLAGPACLSQPSGWGKTTLLRLLMGLEAPDSGSITGVGRVGAVFQEDRLCPGWNALQNVRLVCPRAEPAAILADLAALGLTGEALTLPVCRLSGGQKRRVALLRALWAPADTLLLDEPFTGMDRESVARAVALLQARRGQRPALLASHDGLALAALGWPALPL